jgi:drug/metabolite transporter (DMT)-like permease
MLDICIKRIVALKGLDLKLFYALTSLNYVVVMVLSRIVLRESLSRNKVVAGCLIVAGVVVFNL